MSTAVLPVRPRNDPAQYDDLSAEWWRPYGRFAGLRSLAAERARLVPPPPFPGAPLLDVGCGAGLFAPALAENEPGWRHVGLDLSGVSLRTARAHGVAPVRADAFRLPFADASLHCVVAGELLEHVRDVEAVCAELGRVLAPGGTLVIDTIADTLFARVAVVWIAERLPGGPPPRIHDPALLVGADRVRRALAANGVGIVYLGGLRPSLTGYLRWLLRRSDRVRFARIRSTAGLYQVVGVRTGGAR